MKTLPLKRACHTLMVWGVFFALAAHAHERGGSGRSPGCVECGDTITTNTRLTHDLECSGTEAPALRVVGTGVVLDLGGHTVRRVGSEPGLSEGIAVLANSTVKNGTIQGFDLGYVLDYDASHFPDHVWLSKLTFIDNRAAVYNRSGSATFTISNSYFIANGSAVGSEQDASSGKFEVIASYFLANRLALSANSHDVEVVRSNFTFNDMVVWCPYGGVSFTSSRIAFNSVVGRITLGEFGYGFCSQASFVNTLFLHNDALAPAEWPTWDAFDFVLRDSQVSDNAGGMRVQSRTVDIQGSTLRRNGGGLSLGHLEEYVPPELTGTVSGNRFLQNAGDGLRVLVPNSLTVSGNTAIGNTGWGLHAEGAIDGGGNVAGGNGMGNCAGVVCAPP
ncbi:right-handed parallel beta-helix repeat-containing protein [Hyalangium rubrum]|uniref:Right-handed parallel beta-helix repeat-containing protein n=1 Tax=Hyalangium rubrum TaxID=3103134 RepID=A0ABU5HGA4_9BACT|nr:right-handed parallel beta-helix repeat-containing protein [Hyalangium sp. s54d21]MDY7232490.1 right-handed parallel beta-helix repeat-containing protein [Hyalangium sp. s54d21]